MPPKKDPINDINENVRDYLKKHLYDLLTARVDYQPQKRQFIQIIINKINKQSLKDGSDQTRWLTLLKAVLDQIHHISVLKEYYAEKSISTKAIADQYARIVYGMGHLIKQLAQNWQTDSEYRSYSLQQQACPQIILFLGFYLLHDSQYNDYKLFEPVIEQIRQHKRDIDDNVHKVAEYLYFLRVTNQRATYYQQGYNDFIELNQAIINNISAQLITPEDFFAKCQRVQQLLDQPNIPSYLKAYIKYTNLSFGVDIILDSNQSFDIKKAKIFALHQGFGVTEEAHQPTNADMFNQILSDKSYYYQLLSSLNLLRYPEFLINPVEQGAYHRQIYDFYQICKPGFGQNESVGAANHALLSAIDGHIAMIFDRNAGVKDKTPFTNAKNVFQSVKSGVLPLLMIQSEQFKHLLGFVSQFYDALESQDKLDYFINYFASKKHPRLDELVPILRDSIPATSTMLAQCLNTLLTELYQKKPPDTVHDPVKLEHIVTIYQTARLFYACLNYSFSHQEKQQQLYIEKRFDHEVKESASNCQDNLATFEYVERVLLVNAVELILQDLDVDYYQRVVENIDGLSTAIKQASDEHDGLTRDLLQLYKRWFQWIDYTVQLRQAYQKQDSDLIWSHKDNLSNVIFDVQYYLCDWGLDKQADSLQAKLLLNGQAGQQILLFFLYCDQKHSEGLFPKSLSQGIAQHLYRAATSDQLKTVVHFLYFRQHQMPLDEVGNHLIDFYQNLPCLAQRHDKVRQITQFFEKVINLGDDSTPLYVLKDIESYFIIQSFYYLYQSSQQEAQNFLNKIKIDELNYSQKNTWQSKLLRAIALWSHVNDTFNCFHDPQALNTIDEPYQLFSQLATIGQNKKPELNNQFVRKNNATINQILQQLGLRIGVVYWEAEQQSSSALARWQFIDDTVTNQVMPLLVLKYSHTKKQNPLEFLQSLQQACGNDSLMSFDTSKWSFSSPEAAILLSCKLPTIAQYIVDALQQIILGLYEDSPPQADMSQQDVVQITNIYNLCRYVCDLLGSSIHLSNLNLDEWFSQYKQKAGLTEQDMQFLDVQPYNDSKAHDKKTKAGKKRRYQLKDYKKLDSSERGSDQQQSPQAQDGSPKNRDFSESTSSDSSQSNEAISEDKCASDNNNIHPSNEQPPAQQPCINKDQLSPLLLDIAYWLYQAERVEVALTGSAVPALYRGQPDKARDYDCLAVAESIDTVKNLLMRNGLVDADDKSNVNDNPSYAPRFKLIKAKDRTILVVTHYSTKKIELNTVKPEIGKSNTQVLNEVMEHHLTVSDALFVKLSNAHEKDKLPIEGAQGGCQALDRKQLKLVFPQNQPCSAKQRLVEDPVRLVRLAKFRQTFDDLQPNANLVTSFDALCHDPQWSARLVSRASQYKAQLATAISDMFDKLTTAQVVQSLLDDQMPVLAALTRLPQESLKCWQDTWINYIDQAKPGTSYDKQRRLYQCLLIAYCELSNKDDIQDSSMYFFCHVKKSDYKFLNAIVNSYLDKPLYVDAELQGDSYNLAKQMQKDLKNYSVPSRPSQHSIHDESQASEQAECAQVCPSHMGALAESPFNG